MTAAPITADAAAAKVVGVGKTTTYKVGATVKSVKTTNKKVVKATKSKKKGYISLKGLKAGKTTVTVKTTKKTVKLTVKVGATSITKKTVATSMKAGEKKTLSVNAVNGKGDTIQFTSNKKSVVKVNKASAKANSKKVASTTVTALKAGTAKITAKSKYTGKSKTFTIKVAAAPVATTPAVSTNPAVVATTPAATATVTNAPSVPGGDTTKAPETTSGAATTAPGTSANPDETKNPDATGTPEATTGAATTAPDATTTPEPTTTPEVEATTAPAITATPDPTTGSAVVSLSAVQTGHQKIVVTGSNLSDQVSDYTVKRGNSNVSINSVTVNADKTSATLISSATSLTAGTYTITYGTETYNFEVAAEKITSIEIIGNDLVLDGTDPTKATVGYKILNQFGERTVSSNVNVTCTIGTKSTVKTATTRTADGVIGIEASEAMAVNTKATLVLVEKTTGVSTTANLVVNSAATVKSVEVLGIYKDYATSKATKVDSFDTNANPTDYAIILTAYDQYGTKCNSLFTTGNITITATENTGVGAKALEASAETATIGDETYVAIPLTGSNLISGVSNVTMVSNTSGLLGSVQVKVTEAVKITSLKLNQVDPLYIGTKTYVDYVAKNSEGEEVTSYDTLTKSNIKFSNTGFDWEEQADGSAKLTYTPDSGDVTISGTSDDATTTAIVTTTCNNGVEVNTFTIGKAKMAKQIIGFDKDVALATVANATGKVALKLENFKVQDQYGNVLSDDELAGLTPNIEVSTYETNGKTGFKNSSNVTVGASSDKTLSTSATKTGALSKKDANVLSINADTTEGKFGLQFALNGVDNIGYTTTIQSYAMENISSFEVADIDQVYTDGSGASKDTSRDVIVTGKVGATAVSLSSSDYTIIGSTHLLAGTGTIAGQGDLIYSDEANKVLGSKTETIEVVINNKAGTSIKKDVVVSSVLPKVTTVEVKSAGFKLSPEANASGDDVALSDLVALLDIKDQYGSEITDNDARVSFSGISTDSALTVNKNNTKDATLHWPDAKDTYRVGVTITFSSGVTYSSTLLLTTTAS